MTKYDTPRNGQRIKMGWWQLLMLLIILLLTLLVVYNPLHVKEKQVIASNTTVHLMAETLLFAGFSANHGYFAAPHLVLFQAQHAPLGGFCMAYPYFFYAGVFESRSNTNP